MGTRHFQSAALALVIAAATLSSSCSQSSNEVSTSKSVPHKSRASSDSFLLIEHRGQFHRYEDLMNPTYRAESKDPFVRDFGTETNIAIEWAGMGLDDERNQVGTSWTQESQRFAAPTVDQNTFGSIQRSIPWAGSGPEEP